MVLDEVPDALRDHLTVQPTEVDLLRDLEIRVGEGVRRRRFRATVVGAEREEHDGAKCDA